MQTATDLSNLLKRIDHKGYPAYKDTKGIYQFSGYVLSIDHVQGDPFAYFFLLLNLSFILFLFNNCLL